MNVRLDLKILGKALPGHTIEFIVHGKYLEYVTYALSDEEMLSVSDVMGHRLMGIRHEGIRSYIMIMI